MMNINKPFDLVFCSNNFPEYQLISAPQGLNSNIIIKKHGGLDF